MHRLNQDSFNKGCVPSTWYTWGENVNLVLASLTLALKSASLLIFDLII